MSALTKDKLLTLTESDFLEPWMQSFILDRRASNKSKKTISWYEWHLNQIHSYLSEIQSVSRVSQITPDIIRRYLLYLEAKGHSAGGIHGHYRAIRAFLNWYELEANPPNWVNPIKRVKAPRQPKEPIQGIEIDSMRALLRASKGKEFTDIRDSALFLFLLDSGVRAMELLNINLADMDLITGSVLIRKGKGSKPRMVFLSESTRKALRAYIRIQDSDDPALWVTQAGKRLTYNGLNEVLRRRASQAGIPKPGLHDFRRSFALNFLRNGGDIFSLQKILGHSSLDILKSYLAQTDKDLSIAHRKNSPVQGWDL